MMSRASRPRRTLHPLAVIESLEEQNQKVGFLLGACDTFLQFNPQAKGADVLRKAADECRAAMYPEES